MGYEGVENSEIEGNYRFGEGLRVAGSRTWLLLRNTIFSGLNTRIIRAAAACVTYTRVREALPRGRVKS
jgi:hypothetical protein